jgi:hypothetical protein
MWDVALYFTVCLNLAIAIAANPDLDVFGTSPDYYTRYHDEYIFDDDDLAAFNTSGGSFAVTDAAAQASMGASFVSFIWSLVTGFVYIYGTLVDVLHVPAYWAGIYQTIIYVIYALGFFSLITGRHPDAQI